MLFGSIPIWKLVVDAYIVWVLVFFLVQFISNEQKNVIHSNIISIYLSLAYLANYFDLLISTPVLTYLQNGYLF
jgi:diadenylate cyclase